MTAFDDMPGKTKTKSATHIPVPTRWWDDLLKSVDIDTPRHAANAEVDVVRACTRTADSLIHLQAKTDAWTDKQTAREIYQQAEDLVYALREAVAEMEGLAIECDRLATEAYELARCPEQYLGHDEGDE